MEHSKYGYSAISDFKSCPYKYDLTWNKHLQVIQDDDPTNALMVGTALHRAIETDFETASKEYFNSYPVITDRHITEMMKVEIQSKKVKNLIESSGNPLKHETKILHGDFIGTIDLLEFVGDGHFNMYDFKYSNSVDNYRNSPQLTIYKHFYEKTTGNVIDRMFFIIVPKSSLKQKDNETLQEYRRRLLDDLKEPIIIESKYDEEKLHDYFRIVEVIKQTSAFPKKQNQFCYWCKYKELCERGNDFMVLPSSERRPVGIPTKRKLWIYGATMSGKTTFVDASPIPLNLNTDGNIQFVSMPVQPIKDIVTVEGRITKTTLAWDVFKDTIAELEKKQNDFKTIIVDLLEDTYESCRIYMYDKLGITHESDDSFRAWDKVRTEYLSTIRRLMNLDYENIILISHEDMSKDITKKSGDKVTAIKPNIPEKIANKIAGMVDIVARVVVEDDGSRTLNFKSNEVIFGGGRLKGIQTTQIPLDWDSLMNVYISTSKEEKPENKANSKSEKASRRTKVEEPEDVSDAIESTEPVVVEEAPRQRRSRTSEVPMKEDVTMTNGEETKTLKAGEDTVNEMSEMVNEGWKVAEQEAPVEEAPKRRTRRTRA